MNDDIDALLAAASTPEDQVMDTSDVSQASLLAGLREYRRLRDVQDKIAKAKKLNDEAVDTLAKTIADVFSSRNIKSLKVEGVGTVTAKTVVGPKVNDKQKLFIWLTTEGEDGLIKQEVHYMTLKAFLTDRLNNGLTMPPVDACELTQIPSIALTRSK